MLQYFDPDRRFQMLVDDVSCQIQDTGFSDAKIADICYTSTEFVRRQRKFLSLGPYKPYKENGMPAAKTIHISQDDLHREYIENEKTIAQCAEFFGCSSGVILSRMKEYGIQARTHGGKYPKPSEVPDTDDLGRTPPPLSLEPPEIDRYLERLLLFSAVKGVSIQALIEEALELLFEKYDKKT